MAKILVIDDDQPIRQTIRRILERQGHEIAEAVEGEEGMRLFRSGDFDLVVTDLVMPGQEGIETILALREESPTVPILAVSGGLSVSKTGPLEDAEALGANASLAKPFAAQELMEVVESLLELVEE
jgi:CheY-like chemotaxis protein